MLYSHHIFYITCILSVFRLSQACWPASQLISQHPKLETTGIKDVYLYSDDCKCNHTLITPKSVINPYKKEVENVAQNKPFGSFCLKCAACIAVAEEVSLQFFYYLLFTLLTRKSLNSIMI